MHAQESSIASVSSMIEFLNANGPASFRETATGLVKLILVMPATNALSERSFTSALRRINNYLKVYHDAKKTSVSIQGRLPQLQSN